MLTKNNDKHLLYIMKIMVILTVFTILRVFLLFNTDSFHGIAAGRALLAELILKNGFYSKLCFVPVHPPIHIFVLIAGLFVWNNPMVLPGLISLFFGILSCLPYYIYVKNIFGEKVVLFSLAAMCLYSEHIIYSVIGTSETVFHFFLFSSLAFALLFKKNKNKCYFYCSAGMIAIASLCRYEGLVFIPVIAIFSTRKVKDIVIFLFSALSLPAIWMCVNFYFRGDFLYFLHTNDITVPLQFDWMRTQGVKIDLIYKLMFWPRVITDTMGVFFLIFGVAGVILWIKKRKNLFPAGLIIFLFTIFILRTCQEKLYLQARYSITIGLLIIPFAIFFLQSMFRKIDHKLSDLLVLLLIFTMIPGWGKVISEESLFVPEAVKDIGRVLNEQVKENENIFITSQQNENYREAIKLRSGLNPRQFILIPYLEPSENGFIVKPQEIFKYFKKENIKYFVYSPDGDLGNVLKLQEKGKKFTSNGFCFELIYGNDFYCIYKVWPVTEGVKDA